MNPQDVKNRAKRVSRAATQNNEATVRVAKPPYFRRVKAEFREGEISVDPPGNLKMEKPTTMAFWVGGGALYMH